MAEGDVFKPGEAVRVTMSTGEERDFVIYEVIGPTNKWPWRDKTRLMVAELRGETWRPTWFHADDRGVRRAPPEAEKLIGQWVAHVLLTGEPPELKWWAER